MATRAIVIVDEIDEASEEDEMRLDRLPGMPLLGFVTGATISLALWGLLGWVAWSLLA
jgi:hypothetical protein